MSDALQSFVKTVLTILFFGVGAWVIPLLLLTQIAVPYNYLSLIAFAAACIIPAIKEESRKAMLPFLYDRPMGSKEGEASDKALEDLIRVWKKTKKL